MKELTTKEQICKAKTMVHINNVITLMIDIVKKLMDRALVHDKSKILDPELAIFAEYTDKLAKCTYGSEEYKQYLEEMKPALDHHYAYNRHHPEFHTDGIGGMNLLDLIEMLCDWKAATLRHNDGDIKRSIEINSKRFNIDFQLKNILLNTVVLFDEKKLETQRDENSKGK